jgi:8-oxo-dGTP pyrophosphatase MutT (NUDIX family)
MKRILTIDLHNYDHISEEIKRRAVRGIIIKDGRLLLIGTAFDQVKFPGGGQKPGEDDVATLIREIKEETGYTVQTQSISEFGEVLERRKSSYEHKIWHHISRYYFCEISDTAEETDFTDSEKEYDMHPVWMTIEEAIELNKKMLNHKDSLPWNNREYLVLIELNKFLKTKKAYL